MWPPTEVVFVPNATKSFCEWRGRSTSVRRSQFLVTEVTAARLTTHRRVFAPGAKENFWNWRDRRIIFLRPKCFCDCPTEAKMTVDWSKVSADRNFCDWGDRSTINYPPKSFRAGRDRLLCDWGDRWIIFRRPKFFCDCPTEAKMTADWSKLSADRTFLRLRWPQHN